LNKFSLLSDLDSGNPEINSNEAEEVIFYREANGKLQKEPHKRKHRLPVIQREKRVHEKGKGNSPPVRLKLDRRLPFQTSAKFSTRPSGRIKDRLIFIGKSLKRSESKRMSFRRLLVGTVFTEIQYIPKGIIDYSTTDLKGNLLINKRIPMKLLSSVINMIIYCKSTFCANNLGRLFVPMWELSDDVIKIKRDDSGLLNRTHFGEMPLLTPVR
jgi:hypothetical protein